MHKQCSPLETNSKFSSATSLETLSNIRGIWRHHQTYSIWHPNDPHRHLDVDVFGLTLISVMRTHTLTTLHYPDTDRIDRRLRGSALHCLLLLMTILLPALVFSTSVKQNNLADSVPIFWRVLQNYFNFTFLKRDHIHFSAVSPAASWENGVWNCLTPKWIVCLTVWVSVKSQSKYFMFVQRMIIHIFGVIPFNTSLFDNGWLTAVTDLTAFNHLRNTNPTKWWNVNESQILRR